MRRRGMFRRGLALVMCVLCFLANPSIVHASEVDESNAITEQSEANEESLLNESDAEEQEASDAEEQEPVDAEESMEEEQEEKTQAKEEIILPAPTNVKLSMGYGGIGYVTFDMEKGDYPGTLKFRIQYDDDGSLHDGYYYQDVTETKGYIWATPGKFYVVAVQAFLEDKDGKVIAKSEQSNWAAKTLNYDAVHLKSVAGAGLDKIKLTWTSMADYGCSGYKIYRASSENGSYKCVKTIKSAYTTQWTDSKLELGKTYYYKVRAYDDYYDLRGPYSRILSATPKPAKKALTAVCASSSSVKLSWSASGKEVKGYQIFRANEEDGEFKLIKTIKDRTKTTYINTKRTFGSTYYYKIRAYAVVDGKRIYSDYSSVKKVTVTVGVPVIQKITLESVSKAKISYDKISDADGYMVYRATSKDGTYKRIKTIKTPGTTSYSATGLKNGNTYYFKVRAYKKIDGKTYYSEYSTSVKRLMNKAGYESESYTQKAQRIFNKNYYVEYKSSKAAAKDMKTIKIKTWDINSKGKKYTRYHYLTVHKNIAYTVQQIFKEIYNGDEKFPIKDVGGYSWRGDNSSSLHCEGVAIDINYNENAQFNGETGKPMVGKLYKPGKNPYSIRPNGDVVKAFEKYGFIWGDWFSNPDYMHFSYFGG